MIAINPEIDAVTLAIVGLHGHMVHRLRCNTDGTPSVGQVIRIVVSALDQLKDLLATHRIIGIGAAVPGLVDDRGAVIYAPHLRWHNEPFSRLLSEATGLRVVAANDASLGAVAERRFGAGIGVDDLVYLNGGASGIGAGLIAGGNLLTGGAGFAGEFGHSFVRNGGSVCHCGATGCLETEVSRQPLLDAVGLTVAAAENLHKQLILTWQAGPSLELRSLVEWQIDHLVIALRNAVNGLNPSRIILGGFPATLHAIAADRLVAGVRASTMIGLRNNLQIEPASLGADILLVGAAELAFAEVMADPASLAVPVVAS